MPDPNADTERPDAATAETVVPDAPSIPAPVAPPTASTTASASAAATTTRVGDDLRAVSLSRFGSVERDRYEILGELARGGLGRVFRARDPRTGRVVALKEVLRPSADLLMRFAREALVTANLQHPSIVPVYEVGRWPGGEPFYAMKLVQGRALDDIIAQAGSISARIALVPHVIAIADALAYAHSEHVIHRDLKPANVLVGAYGETVVIDWGLARNLAGGPGHEDEALAPTLPPVAGGGATPGETVAGAVVGTPAYMAPEQAKGKALDERADVYAIGAILYHVLAGVRPYHDARTVAEVLLRVGSSPPRALAELVPAAPRELIAIVERAMAREPDARYPTALELAADLRRYLAGQLVGAHHYSRWQLLRRWVMRNRATVLTASIALAALAVFGAVSVRRIAAERDEARRQHDRAERERAEAHTARALAERRFADSLEELGRQAGLDGNPDRALVFLAAAGAADPDVVRPAQRLMLGQARAAFAGLRAALPNGAAITVSADLTPDGARAVTTTLGELRMWDATTGAHMWTTAGAYRAALSPDGARVLAAMLDGSVAILGAGGAVERSWTMAPVEGERLNVLAWGGARFAVGGDRGSIAFGAPDHVSPTLVRGAAHDHPVHSVAFSPDGRAVLSCADEGAIAVHDAATGARVASLGAPARLVACAWLDDDRIAAGEDSAAGTVRVWRVSTRRVERTLAHGPDLYGLAAGGDWLVTYGHGDRATLWDVAAGRERARLTGHRLAVNGAVAAGRWLVTSDETGGLLVWDPATGDLLQRLPAEGLASLAARGERLVTYGTGRTRVWQLEPERTVRRLLGHTARVRDLLFDERGTLWSASNDGSARGVDLATGAAVQLGDGGFTEPPVRAADQAQRPPNPAGLRSLTLSGDHGTLLTAAEHGTIGVWDVATGARRAEWRGHVGRARRVIYSADGSTAFSVGDAYVHQWNTATGEETARMPLADGETGWDVALLGDRLVTQSDSNRLQLWAARDLAPLPAPAVPFDRLRALVVDGDRLITATADQLIALDRDGRIVAQTAHTLPFDAHLAPGDGPLAVGDSRGDLSLFDRRTLAPIRVWNTGEVVVAAVRFHPGGAILATAAGRRVQLWDPQRGRLIADSGELPAMIAQLAWSPDGRWLAFAGGSGTVWRWDLAPPFAGAIDDFARCASPWRLADSALAAAPPADQGCTIAP